MEGERVETAATSVWVEHGILRIRSKGMPSTPQTVAETFDAAARLAGGTALPMLWDARAWTPGDPQGWITGIRRLDSFTAAAMLVEADAPPAIGDYPEVIDRLLIPFRVFTEESEAVAFLEDHRRDGV